MGFRPSTNSIQTYRESVSSRIHPEYIANWLHAEDKFQISGLANRPELCHGNWISNMPAGRNGMEVQNPGMAHCLGN